MGMFFHALKQNKILATQYQWEYVCLGVEQHANRVGQWNIIGWTSSSLMAHNTEYFLKKSCEHLRAILTRCLFMHAVHCSLDYFLSVKYSFLLAGTYSLYLTPQNSLRWLRKKDCKFKASLHYLIRLCLL